MQADAEWSMQIGPNQPLVHEVGLLSVVNSKESKYLGLSSGVSLARLIFTFVDLGARILESPLKAEFYSESYLATAMVRIESCELPLR